MPIIINLDVMLAKRKMSVTELAEREFSFGSHLVQRDRKAVQKTFSGLMKIIRRKAGGFQRSDQVGGGLGQRHDGEGHQQASFFGAVAGK